MAEAAEQQENGEDLSVHDSVMAAVKTLQEAEEPDEQEAPAEEPTEEPAAPVEEPEPDKKPAEPAEEPEGEPGEPAEAAEEPQEVTLAPASWSKEDREVFAKADDDLKKVIARRETERDQYLRKVNGESAPLRAVAEEYGDYFRQIGISPDQSFRALVAAERTLRFGTPQDKVTALRRIAQDYGISLEAPGLAPQQSDDYADPGLARLEGVFSERLGKIETQLTSRQQADESAQQQQADALAQRFFDQLDQAKPDEFPEARYVEQVMPRFQSFVAEERSSGAMPDVDRLVQLYRDAAYSIPTVRDALEGDRKARDDAARKAAEARTTRTIKKTSSSAAGGSGVVAHSDNDDQPRSVRDDVLRSMRMLEAQQ